MSRPSRPSTPIRPSRPYSGPPALTLKRHKLTVVNGGKWPRAAESRQLTHLPFKLGSAGTKVVPSQQSGAPIDCCRAVPRTRAVGHERVLAQGRFGASQLMKWARLLRRVFGIDIQHCPNCGADELEIIAAIPERPVIEKILTHLGLDPQPPPRAPARESVRNQAG